MKYIVLGLSLLSQAFAFNVQTRDADGVANGVEMKLDFRLVNDGAEVESIPVAVLRYQFTDAALSSSFRSDLWYTSCGSQSDMSINVFEDTPPPAN